MDIFKCLMRDHEGLKELTSKLKSETTSFDEREHLFRELSWLLSSHTVAEEVVVLSYAKRAQTTRMDALEGLEEHHVTDDLMMQIEATRDPEVKWAKIKVLCDILEHHLKEEEENLFPKLREILNEGQRRLLGNRYMEIRGHHGAAAS